MSLSNFSKDSFINGLQITYEDAFDILESINEPFFALNQQWQFVYMNRIAEKVWGKPRQTLLGKNIWQEFPTEVGSDRYLYMRQVMETQQATALELLSPTLKQWIEMVIHPMNGGICVHLRDIGKRKQVEASLRESESKYRRIVETAQEGIWIIDDHSNINKELEAFNYSVSHDLRQPLRALDGFSQAILEDYTDLLDDNGKHYLQRIRLASQRMGHIIDDLLNLSRLSRQVLHHKPLDLSKLALECLVNLQETHPQRSVILHIQPNVMAIGDERLLQIALTNLLENAWKFTQTRQPAIIEFACTQKHGQNVYFVRDNGVGFDMTYASKLFGAFQRLHSTDEFEGTGIGLATVQRIIHRHDGQIWAESVINTGATFYFTVPESETQ
jgi:PAS domain S-box-containing protein